MKGSGYRASACSFLSPLQSRQLVPDPPEHWHKPGGFTQKPWHAWQQWQKCSSSAYLQDGIVAQRRSRQRLLSSSPICSLGRRRRSQVVARRRQLCCGKGAHRNGGHEAQRKPQRLLLPLDLRLDDQDRAPACNTGNVGCPGTLCMQQIVCAPCSTWRHAAGTPS